ncbi:MAG: hypothetical protein M9904_14370 [Chitinophagaceae bacterium]|nr:hypothetical protein [Chitinophagaceae bacterium]
MKTGSLADEFFETRPELLNDIKSFENRHGLRLWSALNTEKDPVNFFSRLNEIRFGLFFETVCSHLRHNCIIENKTPDWLLIMNDQQILCEVLRLNTPEDECRNTIEESRQQRYFQKQNPGVPIITQSPVKTISLEYLSGGQSKMKAKEEKYRHVIEKHQLPFIICVAPMIETFLSELDFADFLLGNRGFFATDENFGQNVTGVLLRSYFGPFFYYNNDQAIFQLTARNRAALGAFEYPRH